MNTLTEIKNQYAQEKGYENWDRLRYWNDISGPADDFSDEIIIRVQKAALEKAAENLRQCSGSFNSDYRSQQISITNEENLIL